MAGTTKPSASFHQDQKHQQTTSLVPLVAEIRSTWTIADRPGSTPPPTSRKPATGYRDVVFPRFADELFFPSACVRLV